MNPQVNNLAEDIALATRLVRAAGDVIMPYFRNCGEITNKAARGSFDPVTAADRAGESLIRSELERSRPLDGVMGEEFAHKPSRSGRRWIIDPIDGTRGFIAGLPLWGILLALDDGQKPILGIGYQPYLNELFLGADGETFLNDQPLSVCPAADLSQARLATTDPDLFTAQERPAFERLKSDVKITRYGTDWYAYAMLAAGNLDLVVESGLKAHDIQALIPIVEGAQGIICDWQGGDVRAGGQILAASSPQMRDAALKYLASASS